TARDDQRDALHQRRSNENVEPEWSPQQNVGEIELRDAYGRQVENRRRVHRDLEQRSEIAELETAVDQDGSLLGLAEGYGEVERDRRLADAAFRGEHGVDP